MACEICGRSACTASFHSSEEQRNFDAIADKVKDRARAIIARKMDKLNGHYHGNNYYVRLDEVLKQIEDYD